MHGQTECSSLASLIMPNDDIVVLRDPYHGWMITATSINFCKYQNEDAESQKILEVTRLQGGFVA